MFRLLLLAAVRRCFAVVVPRESLHRLGRFLLYRRNVKHGNCIMFVIDFCRDIEYV